MFPVRWYDWLGSPLYIARKKVSFIASSNFEVLPVTFIDRNCQKL